MESSHLTFFQVLSLPRPSPFWLGASAPHPLGKHCKGCQAARTWAGRLGLWYDQHPVTTALHSDGQDPCQILADGGPGLWEVPHAFRGPPHDSHVPELGRRAKGAASLPVSWLLVLSRARGGTQPCLIPKQEAAQCPRGARLTHDRLGPALNPAPFVREQSRGPRCVSRH